MIALRRVYLLIKNFLAGKNLFKGCIERYPVPFKNNLEDEDNISENDVFGSDTEMIWKKGTLFSQALKVEENKVHSFLKLSKAFFNTIQPSP